jgi:hypothetical protein
MRERLAVFAQGIATRIGPPFVAARRGFAAVWAFVALWSSRIWRGVSAAALWSFGVARAALGAMLLGLESVLLNAKRRELTHALSVFALIFALAVTSVDMIVTGGPELISSARAASPATARVDLIAATSLGNRREEIQLAAVEVEAAPVVEVVLEDPIVLSPMALAPGRITPIVDLLDSEPVKAERDATEAATTATEAKIKIDA